MGGKALGFEAKRIDAKDLNWLFLSITGNIYDQFPGESEAVVSLIPSYRLKSDHGDMDILLHGPAKYIDRIRDFPGEVFPDWSGDIYKNGGVVSLGIKHGGGVVQLDVIPTGENWDAHDAAYRYFAYNDLGNLIGRIANRMGFKYGHDGLSYTLRDDEKNQVYGEYRFDMQTPEIMGFLGLDADRYEQGFDTLEDIFGFVASSPYFHPDIYLLENVNAVSRIRDKKRKTYMAFLDWLKDRGLNGNELFLPPEARPKFKEYMLRSMMQSDREFADWVKDVTFTHAETNYAKLFWGGGHVQLWTGLQGKELGAFISEFRAFVDGDSVLTFNEWTIMMGPRAKDFTIDYYVNHWKDKKQ